MSADGRILVAVGSGGDETCRCGIARGSIFTDENVLQLPELGGEIVRGDLPIPDVRRVCLCVRLREGERVCVRIRPCVRLSLCPSLSLSPPLHSPAPFSLPLYLPFPPPFLMCVCPQNHDRLFNTGKVVQETMTLLLHSDHGDS